MLDTSLTDTEAVVQIHTSGGANTNGTAQNGSSQNGTAVNRTGLNGGAQRDREPFARFRRNRRRGDADSQQPSEQVDEEADLKVQVMLLREENLRLKAARHQPSDMGTLIDHLRLVTADADQGELVDEAWSLLSECLVIREGLDQVCVEIQGAIGAVRARLDRLGVKIADVATEGS